MKKLRIKMFLVLFAVMSIVVLSLAVVFNVREYNKAYDGLVSMLSQLERSGETAAGRGNPRHRDSADNYVSDLPVAVAYLDYDQSPVVFYANTEDFSEDELEDVTEEIAEDYGTGTQQIPSLYAGGYAFVYPNEYMIGLIDVNPLKKQLLAGVLTSAFLVGLAELAIALISGILTRWMVRPIEQTFEKQKQFIADSSHELKTPLAVIMASADAMAADPNPKWLNNIQLESQRMSQLISRMLELTRSENPGQLSLQPENLSRLVELALLPYESILFEKGFRLEYFIQPEVMAPCDSAAIKQIVAILIDNAMQHTPKGGEIRLDLKQRRDTAVLVVANQGDPIAPGDEKKIFERFYRADDARSRSDGHYGLGLAIAKNIVQSHSGTITAQSANGWTEFTVRLKTA